MISGELRRTRQLATAAGVPVTLQVIVPERSAANVKQLAEASRSWDEQARRLLRADGQEAALHAFFASDVAFIAGRILTAEDNPGRVLVGQSEAGEVLGVTVYGLDPRGVWELDLQTSNPQNQPGYPGADQVRGIGTEMLGAALELMNAELCTSVELECLDEQACRFWRARGFHNTTEPLHMTCPESQALAERLAHTEVDRPDAGEDAEFGKLELLAEVRGDPERVYGHPFKHAVVHGHSFTVWESDPALGERELRSFSDPEAAISYARGLAGGPARPELVRYEVVDAEGEAIWEGQGRVSWSGREAGV